MFREIILKAIKQATGLSEIKLEFPADINNGDYSTNVALVNRLDAAELVEKLNSYENLNEVTSKIEVKNNFINFYINKKSLLEAIYKPVTSSDGGPNKNKRIVIEYSSPNIAKRFSIGHFRSTVIGQAIYNLYDYLGYDVLGLSHIGDWGTQFGMILAEIEITNTTLEDLNINKLEELYLNFNKKLNKNPELREKAKSWFKRLEEGDSNAKNIWEKIRDISLREFNKTYDILNIHIDEVRGESYYEDKMAEVVTQAESNNISTIGEGGAVIVEFEKMSPAMLLKSDGTTTYFTRDLAALKYRVEHDKAEKIIYEVGSEQTLHFRQVFAAVRMFSWGKDVELVHVAHGLIRLPEGKMSTRKGNVIKLDLLLEDSIKKAEELGSTKTAAIKIGIGALKYNDLKRNPVGEIMFDWDEVLSMEGNSGPYLQYTVVRAKSVVKKASSHPEQSEGSATDVASRIREGFFSRLDRDLNDISLGILEKNILRKLARFDEIILSAAKNYSPSTLATYLFDLAQEYNNFYSNEKIIGSENQAFRLTLTSKVANVLERGLNLLGILVPEKM